MISQVREWPWEHLPTSVAPGYFWPVWPMLGMSIAVLIALYRAFGPLPQAAAGGPEPPPSAPPM